MAIDASLTSAWPFGGPNVTPEMGAKYSVVTRVFTAMPKEKVNIQVDTLGKGEIQVLSAYSADGEYIELTQHINKNGILTYTFPAKNMMYMLYFLVLPDNGRNVQDWEARDW